MLRRSIHGGLVLIVVAAVAMAGLALAQTDGTDPAIGTLTVPDAGFEHILDLLAPLVGDGTITEAQAEAVADRLSDRLPRGTTFRPRIDALRIVADTLGVPPRTIVVDLAAGSTLAAVAAAHGLVPEDLVAALVATFGERVETAVAAGELTADQAAVLMDNAPARLAELVSTSRPDRTSDAATDRPRSERVRRGARLAVVADLLGLGEAQLRESLAAGGSLEEIAAGQGVSVDSLVSALVAPAQERLDAGVTAGEVSPAEAQEWLERIEEEITRRVTATRRDAPPSGDEPDPRAAHSGEGQLRSAGRSAARSAARSTHPASISSAARPIGGWRER